MSSAPHSPTGTAPVVLRTAPPLATVRMSDPSGHNRISTPLRHGLTAALREAAADPDVRVVVLEGLPDVFSAGGSIERMLGSHQDRVVEVWEFLRSVLDCPLPVVAAAQGHAMGGGLLLALYCDAVVLSRRSRYAANFLTFGFTPVLGATHLLPAVMGRVLGAEMLYSGRSYRGQELADRGAGVRIVDHARVPETAERLALTMAQATRDCLERLKSQLAGDLLTSVTAALEREIPDHEATIGAEDARWRIRSLHAQRLGTPATDSAAPAGGR